MFTPPVGATLTMSPARADALATQADRATG
jgi:hypothetical protein